MGRAWAVGPPWSWLRASPPLPASSYTRRLHQVRALGCPVRACYLNMQDLLHPCRSCNCACMCAGLRQVRPGGKYFPSWFDVYPNSERIQQVAAPVLVVHVRPLTLPPLHHGYPRVHPEVVLSGPAAWMTCCMHAQGTRDSVCDIEAGKFLHRLAQRPAAPYWAEGCHHENVEMSAGNRHQVGHLPVVLATCRR